MDEAWKHASTKHLHKAAGRTAAIGNPPEFFYYQPSISSIETINPNP